MYRQHEFFKKIALAIACCSLFFTINLNAQAQDPLDLYVAGENARNAGKFADAVASFDKAIALDANNYKFYFSKGKCHISLREDEKAIQALEKATVLKTDYLEAYMPLAKLYQKVNKPNEAIKAYDNAFKYEQENTKKLGYKLNIIKILQKENRLKEAGSHIDEAKVLAADNLEVLYFFAKLANMTERPSEARDAMLKATSLLKTQEPKEIARYYYELGYAYFLLADYAKQDEAYEKAKWGPFTRKILEMSPQYYHSIALAYYDVFEFDKSKELVNQALKMRKDFARAHDLLAKIATAQTDKAQVIEHQKKSIEMERDPAKKAVKFNDLCEVELEGGRFEDAIKSADQCLIVQPKNYMVNYYKAIAQYKLKQTALSTKTLEALLNAPDMDPQTKAMYGFALGLMYEKTNKEKAKELFTTTANYGDYKFAAQEALKRLDPQKYGISTEPEETTTTATEGNPKP
ncbi:MAG: hypothetical protein EAZ57_11780 [Cytophagales bacterium]|nr:MAG: hypothetical protein EAZ67_12830 [Cytophagales bacterium]TAF59271.1 MAG: hypothetical protein EAZ57_11780 [Cytophagales bacterium]